MGGSFSILPFLYFPVITHANGLWQSAQVSWLTKADDSGLSLISDLLLHTKVLLLIDNGCNFMLLSAKIIWCSASSVNTFLVQCARIYFSSLSFGSIGRTMMPIILPESFCLTVVAWSQSYSFISFRFRYWAAKLFASGAAGELLEAVAISCAIPFWLRKRTRKHKKTALKMRTMAGGVAVSI